MREIHFLCLEENLDVDHGDLDEVDISQGIEDGLHVDDDHGQVGGEEDGGVEGVLEEDDQLDHQDHDQGLADHDHDVLDHLQVELLLQDAHLIESQLPEFVEVAALEGVGLDELDNVEDFDGGVDPLVGLDGEILVHFIDGLLEEEAEEQVGGYQGDTDDSWPAGDVDDQDGEQHEAEDVFDEVGVLGGVHEEDGAVCVHHLAEVGDRYLFVGDTSKS